MTPIGNRTRDLSICGAMPQRRPNTTVVVIRYTEYLRYVYRVLQKLLQRNLMTAIKINTFSERISYYSGPKNNQHNHTL